MTKADKSFRNFLVAKRDEHRAQADRYAELIENGELRDYPIDEDPMHLENLAADNFSRAIDLFDRLRG